jgi:mannose-6-phosphate isomerase-like protein (cupin superfamily)
VEECIYVLSGRGRVWIAGESAPVGPGDAVLVPPATPHVVLNVGDELLRLACFLPTPDMPASMRDHPEIELPDELLYARH